MSNILHVHGFESTIPFLKIPFHTYPFACYTSTKGPVLPRIMNFGQIRIPNNIRIFKNDEYEYEYYLEFEKLFEYYSWEIFE